MMRLIKREEAEARQKIYNAKKEVTDEGNE